MLCEERTGPSSERERNREKEVKLISVSGKRDERQG